MIIPKGRVLIVDDEPLVLEMFESILEEEGYDVFVAPSSREAINQIEKTFFDVLVCDVKLEELDGFDVMAIARKKNPGVAVMLITGAPAEEDSQRAQELGAVYLSKPIGFDLLVSTVENAFTSAKSERGRRLSA